MTLITCVNHHNQILESFLGLLMCMCGVQVLIVAQLLSVQYPYKHQIEHIFTLERDGSDTVCDNRHNQVLERVVPITLLQKSILAQILRM